MFVDPGGRCVVEQNPQKHNQTRAAGPASESRHSNAGLGRSATFSRVFREISYHNIMKEIVNGVREDHGRFSHVFMFVVTVSEV